MICDGVPLFYFTSLNDIAGIKFPHILFSSACEGGSDEEVAREEDCERYEEPFSTDEYDGEYLKAMGVSYSFEEFLCLHFKI